ncbi:MAG: hypothetical protein REI78_00715 [Pedobacter sp.]|nr:hypothetical protein [Pedobacter sp.]MDQ8051508.1 hypothetical protein [Pedobacter sp.]
MKLYLFLFVACCSLNASAQQLTPIYFNGESITTNKEAATSYAVFGKLSNEDLWTFKRFDLYDNLLQTGSYKDAKLSIPHGKFTFYDNIERFNVNHETNFKIKGKTRFLSQQGTFVDGKENGEWTLYYPDGNVMNVQHYLSGKLHGEFISFDKYGKIVAKGNYVNGLKDGDWILESGKQKSYYEKGILKAKPTGRN